jgi:hypothetical protein
MESILIKAVNSVQQSELAYCKFLSANDTKSTKAHQSGYLISKTAWKLFLNKEPSRGENLKSNIIIKWQDSFETLSTFTYYGAAKDEFRITGFGRGFPFREEENTGDLFILSKIKENFFEAFVITHDEDIESFFSSFNIGADQTNKIIPKQFEISAEDNLINCFTAFVKTLKDDFPPTVELSSNARNCYNTSFNISNKIIQSIPDRVLLSWLDAEFQLFKMIENERYNERILTPFKTVEELVDCANTILNRRKSRAGKSLEHHLAEVFNAYNFSYSSQSVTEDSKRPDFVFPNIESYLNPLFDQNKLVVLASKTTCKDRWRQILNEADRVKIKHLFTLQQGISLNQLEEMYKYDVCLVVPKPYLKSFPEKFRDRILTLDSFSSKIRSSQH